MKGRSLAYLAFTVLFGLFAALFTQAPDPDLAQVLTIRATLMALISLVATIVSVAVDMDHARDQYVSPERRRKL